MWAQGRMWRGWVERSECLVVVSERRASRSSLPMCDDGVSSIMVEGHGPGAGRIRRVLHHHGHGSRTNPRAALVAILGGAWAWPFLPLWPPTRLNRIGYYFWGGAMRILSHLPATHHQSHHPRPRPPHAHRAPFIFVPRARACGGRRGCGWLPVDWMGWGGGPATASKFIHPIAASHLCTHSKQEGAQGTDSQSPSHHAHTPWYL